MFFSQNFLGPFRMLQNFKNSLYLLEILRTILQYCHCLPIFSQNMGWREEIWEMSLVPPNFEELSNPSGSHTSHRAKSWSYQYSTSHTARVWWLTQIGEFSSSPLKFCSSPLEQISREFEFGSTRFIVTLSRMDWDVNVVEMRQLPFLEITW